MAIEINLINHRYKGYINVSFAQVLDEDETSTVSYTLVKRKIRTDTKWITIAKINNSEGNFEDYFARNDYEYTYRFELKDSTDTLIESAEQNVYSKFDCLVIADKETMYFTPLNAASITLNTQKPFVLNVPLSTPKPSYYCNNQINYLEGACQGIFMDTTGTEDNFDWVRKHNYDYRFYFKNWLTSGSAKIIKDVSGGIWVVGIKTDTISDAGLFSDAEIEGARQIGFSWVEIGEYNESDLYDLNLSDVSQEYWSNN